MIDIIRTVAELATSEGNPYAAIVLYSLCGVMSSGDEQEFSADVMKLVKEKYLPRVEQGINDLTAIKN